MPRAFLVKKRRPDDRLRSLTKLSFDLPPTVTPVVCPYGSNSSLSFKICNGYIQDLVNPPQYYGRTDSKPDSDGSDTDHDVDSLPQSPPESTSDVSDTRSECSEHVPKAGGLFCASECSEHSPKDGFYCGASDSSSCCQDADADADDGVTIGYTYDSFLISDGRSRRKVSSPKEPAEEKIPARYTCNECGKQYATSSNLSRHKQTHRSLDSQQAKRCPHCDKVYVSMPALSMHILTHSLKHTCSVCNKSFSRPWLLQGHLRSHSGEKPYGCAHCGKAFADRSNLRAHMQTHSAYKHFNCKRCNKSFALKSYLNKHYESACLKNEGCLPSP